MSRESRQVDEREVKRGRNPGKTDKRTTETSVGAQHCGGVTWRSKFYDDVTTNAKGCEKLHKESTFSRGIFHSLNYFQTSTETQTKAHIYSFFIHRKSN